MSQLILAHANVSTITRYTGFTSLTLEPQSNHSSPSEHISYYYGSRVENTIDTTAWGEDKG